MKPLALMLLGLAFAGCATTWILSRAPTMKADVYEAIVPRLASESYETDRFVRTVHGPAHEQSRAEAR